MNQQTAAATAGAASAPSLPAATDRAAFEAELDRLRVREKAHTREGDAIAAARRRLPMVEVDASLTLTGPHGLGPDRQWRGVLLNAGVPGQPP